MTPHRLSDRYLLDEGRAFLSGSQALARLPLEQLRADRRAGRHTAAFVSGYPGSPLANYDRDVTAAARHAADDGLTMVVQPGLNEELAATAVMGSQLAATLDDARFEGVIGIWYGKAPGLDRASDAIRHAVFAGTSARGGAVALVGDDPRAKSSTLPSSSDANLVDLHIPVLYPGDVQEAIDLGRHAIALSRASGLWTSVKVVDAVADGTGTVELHADRIRPVMPIFEVDGVPFVPHPSGKLLTPYTLDIEREFQEVRLEVARRYGVENRLNHTIARSVDDWIGLVASGHTLHETLEALRRLGLDDLAACERAGIRILSLGLPVPLDPQVIRDFADGLVEIVVIEEKNPTLESFVKDALYARAERPMVSGKTGPDGERLFARTGALDADSIAPALRSRLATRLEERLDSPAPPRRELIPLQVTRAPFFCSGCPHNVSTHVPESTLVGGGIGCHSMVMLMEPERVGHIVGLTAMGNEGAQWIGMAPFVQSSHLVQNIGDGTLFHSGLLAVRAACASGVNITYKILYNGAVAMTGGQDPTGQLDVPALVRALQAEGVRELIITTDDLARYRSIDIPASVPVWGRSRLIEAQERLARTPRCTVLIHDQRCAAEKRRDRKRGRATTPGFRVVIDERVCEGCGDCGDVSNCLSVQPVVTPFGRKTRIDQGSCNFDLSCMQGDCPSFLTVKVGKATDRSQERRSAPVVPDPRVASTVDDVTIRMCGIGGTGVITASQILGTAAMLDGLHVRGLDQTGLSQKAGPVVSDLRISVDAPVASNHAGVGRVDVLLAFDQLTAAQDGQLAGVAADRTVAVVNDAAVPTGSMVVHPDRGFPLAAVHERLHSHAAAVHTVDAHQVVRAVIGDDATVNVFMLGVAAQLGLLPIGVQSVQRAIELNDVAVERNLAAFAWGRAWAHDPACVGLAPTPPAESTVDLIERLSGDLADYQDTRYAGRFRAALAPVIAIGDDDLTAAVARNVHKLMAYKDEYEVARLLLLPESRQRAQAVGGPKASTTWHLHPPVLRSLGMRRKLRLGRWATPLFVVLRAGRRLRATPFDLFGLASLRRLERTIRDEYLEAVPAIVALARAGDIDGAIAIAELPDSVRGYEHLKRNRAEAFRTELATALARCNA